MSIFYLKRGDTRPTMRVTLRDQDEVAYDLTGATSVTMHVHLPDCRILSRVTTIDADPTTGRIIYTWLATDWTTDPALMSGEHPMEFEVLGPSTVRLTVPTRDYDTLSVAKDIGHAS